MVKTAAGTQVLTGTNTYTGATTINGGNLAVNGSLSTSSSVTVTSPGILSGTGRVGSVTVNSQGTVAPGFGGNGTLTASSLSLAASSVLSYTLGSGTATDSRLSITGSLTLSTALTLTVSPGRQLGQRHVCLGHLRLADQQFQQLQRLDGRRQQPHAGPAHLRLQRRQRQP